jgi:hypothetical protein
LLDEELFEPPGLAHAGGGEFRSLGRALSVLVDPGRKSFLLPHPPPDAELPVWAAGSIAISPLVLLLWLLWSSPVPATDHVEFESPTEEPDGAGFDGQLEAAVFGWSVGAAAVVELVPTGGV